MRLFVALYPPPEVVADLTAQVRRLRIGAVADQAGEVRLVPGPTMHVTLAFLGAVAVDQLPTVRSALGRTVSDWRSARIGPAGLAARIRLGGGGEFGVGRSTVLWIGLRGEVEAVTTLAAVLRAELRRNDLPYDPRPFQPHLTLARAGPRLDRSALVADRSTLDGYLSPSWPLTDLLLMRSLPGPDYQRLDCWPLGD